jgi:hypothetical protein
MALFATNCKPTKTEGTYLLILARYKYYGQHFGRCVTGLFGAEHSAIPQILVSPACLEGDSVRPSQEQHSVVHSGTRYASLRILFRVLRDHRLGGDQKRRNGGGVL